MAELPAASPTDEPVRGPKARWQLSEEWLAANDLTGLSVEEARRRTEEAGFPFCYLELEPGPVPMVLTADLQPGRITATAKGGVVIKAKAGN
jgi:hypothetical protein